MERGRVPPPDFNVMRCAPGGLGQTRKRLPLVREKAGLLTSWRIRARREWKTFYRARASVDPYAPAWLFRSRRLYGNGIPDGVSIKKARCLLTASFLLTRDSVGIRTQDPQLRRLLLYPAELPNHPAYSAGKKRPRRRIGLQI